MSREEAKKIIEENQSFFDTPILNQQEFIIFYTRNNAVDIIRDYSQRLEKLLYKYTKKIDEQTVKPVVYDWKKGDFTSALEHEEICKFIVDNKDHPAITLWRDLPHEVAAETVPSITQLFELSGFNECLKQLKTKADTLSKDKYTQAGKDAASLWTGLIEQTEQLLNKKIDKAIFVESCKNLIEVAENSELKNHRGFFGRVFHNILKALNVITRGYVPVQPTDSIVKISLFKDSLNKISTAEDNDQMPKPDI